jgi:peptidoglycan/xylan/chitin deacetylase (PgdA/CDA1 family)
MLEVEKMKDSRENPVRRFIIRGLLVMAVLLSVLVYGGKGQSPAAWGNFTRQAEAGSAAPLLSKNNPPAAPVQDLPPASVKNADIAAMKLRILDATDPAAAAEPQVSPVQTVSAAADTSSPGTAARKQPRMVYLTFDDGPSSVTPKVLQILHEQGVKATFFVLGDQAASHPEWINAIWEQGHAIGNHTYNHNYQDLYSGFTEFWRQIKQTEETVRGITGVRPQLVRAPGGTFGHFDDTYFYLLKQAGYTVMDWTVDSGDSARKGVPAAEILQESAAGLTSPRVVLLLHDGSGHEQSAKALPGIIERYKAAGYEFGLLDAQAEPVQFRVSAKAAAMQRVKPSKAWISANIAPNSELFAPGKALALEVGRLETRLQPGEYSLKNGQYSVPLRTAVERLGGQVGWDIATHSGQVSWNGRKLTVNAERQQIGVTLPDGSEELRAASVQMIGSSLWVSLRDLLDATGHPPVEATVNAAERRVKAF